MHPLSTLPHLKRRLLRGLVNLRATTLPKGGRVLLLGLVATLLFFYWPAILQHTVDPRANGFTADTTGAAVLGAFQFFAALSMAYAAWRGLFPGLYAYAVECMESKLLEAVTKELLELLPNSLTMLGGAHILAVATERRKIATLQFTIRCVRFVFSVLPFFLFLQLANHALTAALTAVPAGGPGL